MGGPVVLVAARDQEVRRWLASALALRGIECRTVSHSGELHAPTEHPLVVITERTDTSAGASAPPVMVMLPLEREQAIPRIERLVAQAALLPAQGQAAEAIDALVAESSAMQGIMTQAARAATTDAPVLLTGETGSGKERLAQLLHARGRRHKCSFVAVNCGALPEGLVESELFGFERGAFTGATGSYEGKFGLASGGTLFLDEIGEMSLASQAKVLRALDSGEMFRLGGRRPVPFDARIIAATNRDLEAMVAAGTFRQDLYYRLNVVRIHMPPLRERPADIPQLALRCVREFASRYGRGIEGLDSSAVEALQRYGWPGNIRELRNAVESACIACDGPFVAAADLPALLRERLPTPGERERVLQALHETHWNKSRAAEKLNWSRMTLYRKLVKYRLE